MIDSQLPPLGGSCCLQAGIEKAKKVEVRLP
jgi:hypothetical protein